MSARVRRVAVLDDYQGVALDMADWSVLRGRVEVDVFRDHLRDADSLIQAVRDHEVVVAFRERTPFPRAVLEKLPALELLVTTGMANAVVDEEACRALGIVRSGTHGERHGTVELTWALILALGRHLLAERDSVRSGGWTATVGADLFGATLGLLGLGHIGGAVARTANTFGMDVIAWSQNLTAERCAEVGAQLVTKDDLFERSDFLSIQLVLSERTRGLVGDPELRQMKPTAFLVNTSRGPICDEDALVRACRERRIAGAALDTFGTEPLPPDHPFRTLDNVLATPHIGVATQRNYRIFFREVVEDIVAFLDGSPVRLVS